VKTSTRVGRPPAQVELGQQGAFAALQLLEVVRQQGTRK
jgi:hypothetical protein